MESGAETVRVHNFDFSNSAWCPLIAGASYRHYCSLMKWEPHPHILHNMPFGSRRRRWNIHRIAIKSINNIVLT